MTENRMKSRLHGGDHALGAWIMLREPMAAAIASRLSYDYVCFDMQHGLGGIEHGIETIAAVAAGSATAIARPPSSDPGIVGRLLDAGAQGMIFPMVNSAEDAAAAVDACRFAPKGSRSFGPIGALSLYGNSYLADANEQVSMIPMIETGEALENLDAILSTDGVDAVYVGPSDLSLALGLPPGMDSEEPVFVSALERIVERCAHHGVVPGIHCSAKLAAKRSAQGFRMLTVGYDYDPVAKALRVDLRTTRESISGAIEEQSER